jgi:glycosyltransferase involved in cell wall biosynthesis
MANNYTFPGVTLMITHYNRSRSLERLLQRLRDLGCNFEEIVVSDDCSKQEHQEHLKAIQPIFNFRIVPGPVNKGFPANINKGQDAVRTPYTLYIQEDFVPSSEFPPRLMDALQFMNEDGSLDYIRFWSFYRYPTMKPYGKGFSQPYYNRWNLDHRKFFMYSDNPHLRRSDFLKKFGRYREDINGNISEYRMSISFIQKKGKGLFYEQYDTLFDHANSELEPSTFDRPQWKQRKQPHILFLRWLYLKYKFMRSVWEVHHLKL